MDQTIAALKAQAESQARMLDEKDRQILELHALLRDTLRRPTLALPAHVGDRAQPQAAARPWWRRLFRWG